MSYLRSSQNRNNLADLKRVFETPKKGIGKTTIDPSSFAQTDSQFGGGTEDIESKNEHKDEEAILFDQQ
jgi:hypothetical protein